MCYMQHRHLYLCWIYFLFTVFILQQQCASRNLNYWSYGRDAHLIRRNLIRIRFAKGVHIAIAKSPTAFTVHWLLGFSQSPSDCPPSVGSGLEETIELAAERWRTVSGLRPAPNTRSFSGIYRRISVSLQIPLSGADQLSCFSVLWIGDIYGARCMYASVRHIIHSSCNS